MKDVNIEELPTEEITFDFEIYSPARFNSIKKFNKNTYFIKDQPKNFKEEENDAFAHFHNLSKEVSKLKKRSYRCESRACSGMGHFKHNPPNYNETVNKVMNCIKDEFPNAVLAHYDDYQSSEKLKVQDVKKGGMNDRLVVMDQDSSLQQKNNKDSNSLVNDIIDNLNFKNQMEKRPLEAKENVIKFGKFKTKFETEKLMKTRAVIEPHRTNAMQDLMLIDIKIGESGTLSAMLDSGASISLVNSMVKDQIGAQWSRANTVIMGIGDKDGRVPDVCGPVNGFLGGVRLSDFVFHCLPDLNAGYDVILGRDFLSKYNIEIYTKQRKINVGCKHSNGDRSAFTIYQPEVRGKIPNKTIVI